MQFLIVDVALNEYIRIWNSYDDMILKWSHLHSSTKILFRIDQHFSRQIMLYSALWIATWVFCQQDLLFPNFHVLNSLKIFMCGYIILD